MISDQPSAFSSHHWSHSAVMPTLSASTPVRVEPSLYHCGTADGKRSRYFEPSVDVYRPRVHRLII